MTKLLSVRDLRIDIPKEAKILAEKMLSDFIEFCSFMYCLISLAFDWFNKKFAKKVVGFEGFILYNSLSALFIIKHKDSSVK